MRLLYTQQKEGLLEKNPKTMYSVRMFHLKKPN